MKSRRAPQERASAEPLRWLPLLEATMWETAIAAALEGDRREVRAMGELLADFDYWLSWVGELLTLHHLPTRRVLSRRLDMPRLQVC